MFSTDTSQLFQVRLPDDKSFEEVRIHLSPRTTLRPFDNCKIYGSFGEIDPKASHYDFKSVSLYENGEGVFLSKDQVKSNVFKILVLGQSQTTYKLSLTLVEKSTHEVHSGDLLEEYIEANHTKVYHINFHKKDN